MKNVRFGLLALLMSVAAYAAGDVVSAVEASITKVDAAGKTITVKAADGTEHTFHVVGHTVIHGSEATGDAAKGSLHGLAEGGNVVVHYSKKGTEETAEEIDRDLERIDDPGSLMLTRPCGTPGDAGPKPIASRVPMPSPGPAFRNRK